MANLADLVSGPEIVKVTLYEGTEKETSVELTEPCASEQFAVASLIGSEVDVGRHRKSVCAAVLFCLPGQGLTEDIANKLIRENGGFSGELAETAWRLAGMQSKKDQAAAEKEAEERDATPFS